LSLPQDAALAERKVRLCYFKCLLILKQVSGLFFTFFLSTLALLLDVARLRVARQGGMLSQLVPLEALEVLSVQLLLSLRHVPIRHQGQLLLPLLVQVFFITQLVLTHHVNRLQINQLVRLKQPLLCCFILLYLVRSFLLLHVLFFVNLLLQGLTLHFLRLSLGFAPVEEVLF
jgi:hypothetical protein